MAQPLEDVYCTLLMSDSYLPGAAVLSHSLRDAGTTKKLAVLVTMETLSADTITRLRALYDYVIPVERLRSPNLANLYLMGRPDLSYAFTKIALWRQTRFRKIVYLDADVVALRALDELFDIEAPFAAAPDIGWPDAFNSGVMVLTPDMSQYWALHTLASSGESFDGADQGLLNQYYENRPWQRLKFTYNTTPNAEYQWEPAYQHYKKDINAVHFIGKDKPWTGHRSGRSSASNVYNELLGHWWSVHDKHAQDEVKDANHPDLSAEPHLNDSELASDNPWDATRSGPPVQSKPEAANFPTQTYNFSDSRDLFKAPGTYPHPPTDMWYQVPNAKPAETLNPIFPWERQPDRARATRVFAEDLPSEPTPAPATSPPTHAFSTVHFPDDKGTAASSGHSSPPKAVDESWQSFQHNNGNAWDNVPGIDNYVRSIMDSQVKRGSPQVLQNMTGTQDISSPIPERRSRRESLILTDFPSAVERPSLPVTPAPQKRPTFWGGERDGTGELPAATGVPDQTEWNPEEKLEQLRRSSLVEFEHLKNDEHPNPPLRTLPEDSAVIDDSADSPAASKSVPEPSSGETGVFKPGFTMSDFGTEFGRQEKNEPTSPSQARVTERDSAPKEPEQEFLKLNVAENKPAVEDSEGAAKPSTHEPAVAQPSDVVEKDVTDQSPHAGNVPETGSSYKDVAKKDIPEQDLGLKKDVTEEDSPSKKDVAEPKAVAVEDDVKKDVVEDVVAEKVAAKQDPVANDDVVSKDASGPFIPLQEDARPESASKEVAGSSHPKPQSSTDSSSSAKPDITREEPAPSPHDDVVGERAVESSPSHNDAAPIPSSTKDVDGSLSSTPQGSTEQKPAEKEIDNRKVVKEVLPFPPQQASTPQNVDEQSPSTKQVSTPQDVSGQPSKEEKSPVSNTTSQPDQPAGLISSITSLLPSLTAQEPSATQQPTTTERSTSEPEEDNTLSSFIKAGQNLIGIGAGTPPQTSSSVSPTVPQSTSSQNPSSEGSTLTGLLQAGKDLVGLGTDKPTHEPSGGLPSTSDKSIAYVPTSTQGSTIARPSMNDEIPAIHDAGKHVPSVQQGLPDALGLFSASTPQQSSLTSVSHPSILQELASVNRDSKFPDTARAGEHSPRIGSYGSSSRDSSSRPYGGPVTSDRSRHGSVADGPTSYHDTSKPLTERLYHPSGSHSSSRPSSLYESAVPSGESYTAQLERLYNASGGSRRSSLYEPASYSPNLASSSELPSLATARTSSSRPSSLYESSSSSTHKPFSTLNPQYSPTLGKSLHEQSAMHHSLPSRQSPSSVADRGSVSGLSYSGHSPASYSTSGLSATPYSPSLAEGSYTQQILAGQTNLHIPGFEESAFKVPDTDHVEQSIEGGEVKFSGIAQDERGRKR